jgi:hypothetical protein
MAAISTHLNQKAYQIAVTRDFSLPLRKWDHKGTCWAVSARSAVYIARGELKGDIVKTHAMFDGVACEFADGVFMRVAY